MNTNLSLVLEQRQKHTWAQILPASSQEKEAQSHVMSHVESVIHLTTSSLV